MGYCPHCGSEIKPDADVCLNCGRQVNQTMNKSVQVVDEGGFGWGLLGFCIPIVGLVLFIVWNNDKPNSANAAGIGALIGFILGVIVFAML